MTGSRSYTQAKIAIGSEAAVVDNIFETAAYLPEPFKRRLQRSAVRYSRAVAGPERRSMATGGTELSPVPSNWTGGKHNGIRKAFQDMGPNATLFTALLAADGKRGDSRRDRLAQAAPKLPDIVFVFLLSGIAIGLFFAILLIRGLDRPYTGPLALEPVAMQTTADDVAEDFIEEYGKIRVRCDMECNPTGSGS